MQTHTMRIAESTDLESLAGRLEALLERIKSASMRDVEGSTWYNEHRLRTNRGSEGLKNEINTLKAKADEIGLELKSAAEMAIWLRDGKNQEKFIKWVELGVEIEEKSCLGCSAAQRKIQDFAIADFQNWPIRDYQPTIREILANGFDPAALTKSHLEEVNQGGETMDSRLRYSYIPALQSPHEEIRAAARESYEEGYGLEKVKKWGDSELKKRLLSGGSARNALGLFMEEGTYLKEEVQRVGLNLKIIPKDSSELDVLLKAFENISSDLTNEIMNLKSLVLMAYIEENCLSDMVKKSLDTTRQGVSNASQI